MSCRGLGHAALVAGAIMAGLGALGAGFGAASASSEPPTRSRDVAGVCGFARGATVRVDLDTFDAARRSALVHLPPRHRGALPLLVALHGASGTGAFMERYSGLSRLADREGFAVVYPDSAGSRWRIAQADGDADVRFIDALLDRLLAARCFDADRVSVVGVSNGGGMAARLACEAGERLAGLVSVAGSYKTLPACQARSPLSVLEIHGTADAVVPYWGDPKVPQTDIVGWVRGWAYRDGCAAPSHRRQARPKVVRLDWHGCRDGASVAHLRLVGGAHAWPGADPADPGPNLGVSASQEAWRFLRGRRRAARVAADRDGR
jgi:polyhydroxybutyrate depolymerase